MIWRRAIIIAVTLTTAITTLGAHIPALSTVAAQCILLPTINAGVCSLLLEVPFGGISELTQTNVALTTRCLYFFTSLPWLVLQTTSASHIVGATQNDLLTVMVIVLFPTALPDGMSNFTPGLMLTLMLINSRIAPSLSSAAPTQSLLQADGTSNYWVLLIVEMLFTLGISFGPKRVLAIGHHRNELRQVIATSRLNRSTTPREETPSVSDGSK